MLIQLYTADFKSAWDNFIKTSKNGHFMFMRDYMEYHADRFEDHSLIVTGDAGKVIALLPANSQDGILFSHQGLTFGGFVVDERMTTATMLDIFAMLEQYARNNHFHKIVYKVIPHIYHLKPAEEDRYALFRYRANLVRRDVSSTIALTQSVRYSKGRKWTINKAKKEALSACESKDISAFWGVLESVLSANHGVSPVHTYSEIERLSRSFPANIKLFVVKRDATLLAGALIYENTTVAHTQYLANSEEGRQIGALDYLLDHLIREVYIDKPFFDFGISNENSGWDLNDGLIAQKEGFGACAVVHDFYEWNIA